MKRVSMAEDAANIRKAAQARSDNKRRTSQPEVAAAEWERTRNAVATAVRPKVRTIRAIADHAGLNEHQVGMALRELVGEGRLIRKPARTNGFLHYQPGEIVG